MKKTQRLDKILAHSGYGTRSEIKRLVKQGVVTVNDTIVKDSGIQVDPHRDAFTVSGQEVRYREFIYLMLNKPQGVVSATEDTRERTVLELLDAAYSHVELFPVGRLDKDTEGLLLLTNDGPLAHQLLSPRKHVPKTYYAEIEGSVGELDIEVFGAGIKLEDGYRTLPAELIILPQRHDGTDDSGLSHIELTIVEGKFHQVKRMFQAVGKKVRYLKRIRMGTLYLDMALPTGQYRELSDQEVHELRGVENAVP